MSSFSHASLNSPANRDTKTIVGRVREGLDLFGREGERYERVYERVGDGEGDFPAYVRGEFERGGRFGWLVGREGTGAGFVDFEGEGDGNGENGS